MSLGFRVEGSGFRVWGRGLNIEGCAFRFCCAELEDSGLGVDFGVHELWGKVEGSELWVQSLGFGVSGFEV